MHCANTCCVNTSTYMPSGKSSTSRKHFSAIYPRHISIRDTKLELFLELPKVPKERKHVTSRIVTKEDVETCSKQLNRHITTGELTPVITSTKSPGAIWRIYRTTALGNDRTINGGAVQTSCEHEETCRGYPAEQDKIRMQHHCPLHPQVVEAILPVLDGPRDDEPIFEQRSFQLWLRYTEVHLRYGGAGSLTET
jgi:hypothetical protein